MTPDEAAKRAIHTWKVKQGIDTIADDEVGLFFEVRAAIKEAVEAERAACAQIAWDRFGETDEQSALKIARAIEARKD